MERHMASEAQSQQHKAKTQVPRLLPAPARDRDRFLVPVPLYGSSAQLLLPRDMTQAEARKLANVILAYGDLTAFNVRPLT